MGIFSKEKEEKKLGLLFDIGSSSVGGAVFEIKKNGIPNIIFSTRESIVFEEKLDSERFLFLTIRALKSLIKNIHNSGVGKIDKAFCVLSSPWYASQTRVIRLEKNIPFIFTSKLADELIQKEIKFFEEEHISNFSGDSKVKIIEFKNMKTMLNGYPSIDPFDKKIKKLEMIIFISMSSEKILKKLEDTILSFFHFEDIKFSSFAMASFTIARDLFVKQENFLLVDIAGEVTDISIIKKDVLNNSVSFPLGFNFIVRKVSEELDCSLSEAKSLISLYKDGHAEEITGNKLELIINKLKNEWLESFQKSLIEISEDVSLPSTIFITVDQDLINFFSKIIKTEQFNQYTFVESEFLIIFINTEMLHGVTSFKEDVIRDPFVIIESIYINRFIC